MRALNRFPWTAVFFTALMLCGFGGASTPLHASEAAAPAEDGPKLVIKTGTSEVVFRTADLLRRKDVETITFKDVSAYPRQEITLRAVKMATLLKDVKIGARYNIEFVATDGFGTSFKPEVLRNTSPAKAIAYLAVEDPAHKWPLRRNSDASAGPYYLFWVHPELSGIGREEWPFLIDYVAIKESIETRYPKIQPAASLAADDPIRRGYGSFVKNCMPCHTINGEGPGSMGPDLNLPTNPTEYFRPGILRQIIRNSQSIRQNAHTPMGPFPPELISDAELNDLIAYLAHMAVQRGGDVSTNAMTPSPEDVKALVTRSLKSWETGDRAAFIETADPSLTFAFPGRRTDVGGALKVFDKWQAEYSDIKVYIRQIIVDGDRFAMEYQFANTSRGGQRSVVGTVAVGQVRNGRIVTFKEYLDGRVSRAQEAGLMPLDEGAEPFPWPPIDLKEVIFPPMVPRVPK